MAPTDRFVLRFAAEPPQEPPPYGRWAQALEDEFRRACATVDSEGEDLGEIGEILFYPDRTYAGRTYLPMTAGTSTGWEFFGYVSYIPATGDGDAGDLRATADVTSETAEANPDWKIDLCDEVIGSWRGEQGKVAQLTLVWGRPTIGGGAIVTAELADLAVDQCPIVEGRFTLVAADDYRGDTIEVLLFDRNGKEIARESLYEDDGED
jgi:hypothetical protein